MISQKELHDKLFYRSLLHALEEHSVQRPNQLAFVEINGHENDVEPTTITYAELYRKSKAGSVWLDKQFQRGSKVNVYACSGINAAIAYFSVISAELVPVMVPTPANISELSSFVNIIGHLSDSCEACASLLTPEAFALLQGRDDVVIANEHHRKILFDDLFSDVDSVISEFDAESRGSLENGHIIFTSGTTSTAKPVRLSTTAIAFNLSYTAISWNFSTEDSILTLGAPYHSAGLMVGYLMPVYVGASAVIADMVQMSCHSDVVMHWLSKYKITHLACSDSVVDRYLTSQSTQHRDLDLSSWKKIIIGGEPLRASTLNKLKAMLSGIDCAAPQIASAYGMTEAAGLITTTGSYPPKEATISIDQLTKGFAVACSSEPKRFVASGGRATNGVVCVVVDQNNCEVERGRIGKVLFYSPSLFSAYEGIESAASFQTNVEFRDGTHGDGFFDTGDLGFSSNNGPVSDITIIGRLKEAIKCKDALLVAPDIEEIVEKAHPALVDTLFVAVQNPKSGDQNTACAIVCEMDDREHYSGISNSITNELCKVYPEFSFRIIFTAPNALPRISTSSKKPRLRIYNALKKGLFPISFETVCAGADVAELVNCD